MSYQKPESTVKENDVILVYIEDAPAFFARVEGFTADRKPKWWHVKLLVLNVPLQVVTWILRMEQLNGQEPFTMNGTAIRIEKVVAPLEKADLGPAKPPTESADTEERAEKPKHSDSQKQATILTLGGEKKKTE